jgi:hypothetical protein
VNGTWFQLINNNGTLTVNDGPNGLQKLDTVLKLAEKHKLFLMLSLTNNWNPEPTDSIVDQPINFTARDMTGMINATAQRNFLSNQYGSYLFCPFYSFRLTAGKVEWTFMYDSSRPPRNTANFTPINLSSTLSRIIRPKLCPATSTTPIFFRGMSQ